MHPFVEIIVEFISHFIYKATVSFLQPTNDITIDRFMQFITLLMTDPDLQAIDDFDELQCLIVGDLTVHCYIREEETEASRILNLEIAIHPPKLINGFERPTNLLYWNMALGRPRISIIPTNELPYVPTGFQPLQQFHHTRLPLIDKLDLMVCKAYTCGMRSQEQNDKDAADVVKLIELINLDHNYTSRHRPTSDQLKILNDSNEYLAKFGKQENERV
ncbi:uncharacterized protein BO87DRAFT_393814 [Aspergillus neoniger CBS 115656]|uniref:Uncharacterized protein n=1 Tax=Aspergillus neoniger (strain CBS 115656) TaxID=1448310 RepID=A0A318YUE9_ASPNB|nr:hypothetical protein BO87DRAFT_393814 [Aspergillus neoniger CBS 115656]PYH38391.1 hypothetical protein BO87DRAFT_393814 [Aspergillus neoniger CBS 115656]